MGKSRAGMWAVLALAELAGFVAVLVLRYGELVPASSSRLTFVATMLVASIAVVVATWMLSARSLPRFVISTVVSLLVFGVVGFVTWALLVSLAGSESWPLMVALWALIVLESLAIAAAVSALIGRVRRATQGDAAAGDPA